VDVRLKRLTALEAANAIQTDALTARSLQEANILVLRGQPEAIDAAIKCLADLDDQVSHKWLETLARKKQEAVDAAELEKTQRREVEARSAQNSITIEFAGGTVGDDIKLVSARLMEPNVVLGNDAITMLKMPAVTIRSVTGPAAIMLLETLPFDCEGAQVSLRIERVDGDPEGVGIDSKRIQVVNLLASGGAPVATKAPSVRTDVFNLVVLQRRDQPMLKGLLDAIAAGAEMNGKSSSFSMKFHEGSGLLFVHGTRDDIGMVDSIVSTVMDTTGNKKDN